VGVKEKREGEAERVIVIVRERDRKKEKRKRKKDRETEGNGMRCRLDGMHMFPGTQRKVWGSIKCSSSSSRIHGRHDFQFGPIFGSVSSKSGEKRNWVGTETHLHTACCILINGAQLTGMLLRSLAHFFCSRLSLSPLFAKHCGQSFNPILS
jgi:hypothetical protein